MIKRQVFSCRFCKTLNLVSNRRSDHSKNVYSVRSGIVSSKLLGFPIPLRIHLISSSNTLSIKVKQVKLWHYRKVDKTIVLLSFTSVDAKCQFKTFLLIKYAWIINLLEKQLVVNLFKKQLVVQTLHTACQIPQNSSEILNHHFATSPFTLRVYLWKKLLVRYRTARRLRYPSRTVRHLVYSPRSLVSDSMCLPIQLFVLPIHYHLGQASQLWH